MAGRHQPLAVGEKSQAMDPIPVKESHCPQPANRPWRQRVTEKVDARWRAFLLFGFAVFFWSIALSGLPQLKTDDQNQPRPKKGHMQSICFAD
jgi:hypothetical protein